MSTCDVKMLGGIQMYFKSFKTIVEICVAIGLTLL